MMKYTVLSEFADLQDEKHVYGIGDVYPREGYTPTAERVDELSTGKNLLHKALIQKVEEVVEVKEQTEEVMEEAEEKPKRKRGKKSDD